MSYCRFSSMNWMCDVYVYESVYGGWTIHVARQRRKFPPIPDIPIDALPDFGARWGAETDEAAYPSRFHKAAAQLVFGFWSLWHRQVHLRSLNLIPMRKIKLACAGETFNLPTAAETADRLEWLRVLGYNVPQHVIKTLREEAEEQLGVEAEVSPA